MLRVTARRNVFKILGEISKWNNCSQRDPALTPPEVGPWGSPDSVDKEGLLGSLLYTYPLEGQKSFHSIGFTQYWLRGDCWGPMIHMDLTSDPEGGLRGLCSWFRGGKTQFFGFLPSLIATQSGQGSPLPDHSRLIQRAPRSSHLFFSTLFMSVVISPWT